MTDVVGVSLITAGASLLGGAMGAVSTYRISSRSAQAAVETAESQNKVELARIEAENSRLRAQHLEDERRNRQSTYHRTLTAIQGMYSLELDSEHWEQSTAEWRNCRSGVQIFGSKAASVALDGVHDVIMKLPDPGEDREAWSEELKTAMSHFIAAVRADVGVQDD